MQKWEYKTVSVGNNGGELLKVVGGAWMQEHGEDGWELVTILLVPDMYVYVYTFKRVSKLFL